MPGGTVTLTPEGGGAALTLIMNGPPDRSGGIGGWASVERSGRRPGKWWQSQPDEAMSIECTLDMHALPGPSVEKRIADLQALGRPSVDLKTEPPVLRLSGDVLPIDKAVRWVMSDLKFGERLYFSDGKLRRQVVTVDLERYNDVSEIEAVQVTRTRRAGKARRRRTVVAHTHDTLRAIALRELGNPSRWTDLRQWNTRLKKVDPDAPLRRGTRITIR